LRRSALGEMAGLPKWLAPFGAGLVCAGFLLSAPPEAHALKCNSQNPDSCETCEDLEKAYANQYRGVQVVRGRSVWTPIYAAYFRNCPALAQTYLQGGARAAVGGMEGDMLATVISWDRFEVEERRKWVLMLVRAGAKLDSPKITGMTTRERLMGIVADYGGRDDIMQLIAYAEQSGG
jgi:hypothetical protein